MMEMAWRPPARDDVMSDRLEPRVAPFARAIDGAKQSGEAARRLAGGFDDEESPEEIVERTRSGAAILALLAAMACTEPAPCLADEPPADAKARRAAQEERREQMSALSPFSQVAAPPGVEVKPAGMGEGEGTYRYWRVKAEGTLSPAQLIEHYGSALEGLGWSFRPSIEEGVVAYRTGEYRDTEGAIWHVLALAAPSLAAADRCIVTIHLTRVE